MNKVCAFLLCVTVASCASYGGSSLLPGRSTEAEVRATMGSPAVEFANPEGGRDLFYPRGPMGTETFRATIGRDGVLRSVGNVLDDGTFDGITAGMTEEQVLRRIGPPGKTMAFPISRTHAWDYRYTDTWGYDAIFSVTFDAEGVALSKLVSRIEGRDRRR